MEVVKQSIKKYPNHQHIVSTSMGKDSKLVEYIVRKAIDDYRIIFNNTTCDSSDVYREVKARPEIEIVTRKDKCNKNLSLYNMAKDIGFATRHHRWCCGIFKEGSVNEYLKNEHNIIQYLGMRNEESKTRSEYLDEKEDDRFPSDWHMFLPIRKWTELELWLYTIHNNLPINTKYKKGYSRVGCHICCPFYTKSTWVLDNYWYKNQYDRFHNYLKENFCKKEGWCWSNTTIDEYQSIWNTGSKREQPTDEVIQEFMDYKGLDSKEVAKQYFNKTCCKVENHTNKNGEYKPKNVYKKDEVAMNLKLFGRNINKFMCKKCLMKEMEWAKEDWNREVEKFKQQGCNLF